MYGRRWLTLPLLGTATLAAAVAPRLVGTPTPDAPSPAGPEPVVVHGGDERITATIEADRATTDTGSRRVGLHLDLVGAEVDGPVTPTDLVVVLDRSGSMSGTKIEDARAAASALVGLLRPEDRFALVSFASDAHVDIPLSVVGRNDWAPVIAGLSSGGSTDMAQGLAVAGGIAERVAGRTTRVILVSDGAPDDRTGLAQLVRGLAVREIPLTAVGIGDDWDEQLMASLADAGTGNLHWVQRGQRLESVLAAELSGSRSAVAQAAELVVDGPFTIVDAGGFPTDGKHVQLGQVLAGQRRGLWLQVELDQGAPGAVSLGSVGVRWRTPEGASQQARLALGQVEVVRDERVAWASLGDGWARNVVEGDWNDLKNEVAEQVRAGDQDAALEAISRYRLGNETMNAYAQNKLVVDNLEEASALEAEVRAQFVGADQAQRQNAWAKTNCVEAKQARKGLSY
ncbi:MAG: VWA domain-containing protein [Alphaproteobacteria bacterium]|nr:VWA domain-containing protein [Alphaproteobacteria bacterium]MCB9696187.1 VWA domain-containing protein [Alphaproteobacteria bacterium]